MSYESQRAQDLADEQALLRRALLVTDHRYEGDGSGRCAVLIWPKASAGAKRCMQLKAQHTMNFPRKDKREAAESVARDILERYERIVASQSDGCEHSGDGDQVCWHCREDIFVRVAVPVIMKAMG